ncbi:MAG TPA: hypothetical protein VFL12_11450 [Thermoanaerobaculia bacterium]|nr:hypothetical protein [Thermoanaerobaculia bacterium]
MIGAAGFLLAAAASAVPSCRTDSPAIERMIAGKARALSMTENCQFRRYDALDDVDGDGQDDLVLIFTLEGPDGANDHVSFLAAFLSGAPDRPLVVEAGRRGRRDPVAIDARRGEIRLETLEYLPKDPMCCPSGKGTRTWRLEKGRLVAAR